MAAKNYGIDSQNTSPKEIIRRNIRHALSNKSTRKYPNIDLNRDIFEEVESPEDLFVHNFRALGGKFIPCKPDNFCEMLTEVIKNINYNTIFCADVELNMMLQGHHIPTLNTFLTNDPADAAVIFSDTLIARSGSMIFKQEYTQYPSIKNLAKDIIVIAKIETIVTDLKEALQFQDQINSATPAPLIEIITPSPLAKKEDQDSHSAVNQRFILFLIC